MEPLLVTFHQSFILLFISEKQTYEAQKESRSKLKKNVNPAPESESETVYVNIWNTENGKLKLSQQKTLPSSQLKISEENREYSPHTTHPGTPMGLLWSPEYSDPVGGVGDSNNKQLHPSVNNFYQNLDDNQELFQFVSNPKVSFDLDFLLCSWEIFI